MTTANPAPVADTGTLLRELNHRINDQFASAIDLIAVEAVRAEGAEAKVALNNAIELLRGHAGVHCALRMPRYRSLIDAATYLRKLGEALRSAALDRMGIELTLDGDRVPLQAERCWRLGLIVHELVTTASKHPCFDRAPRLIRVKLVRTDELVNCIVSDNGSAVSRAKQGQALRIVRDLARGMGGRVERGAGVTSVVLSFALTARERQASCAIDSRRLKPARQVKALAAEVRREREARLFGQGRRPANVPRAVNEPPTRGGELASRCSTDPLGELLSSSHRMDAI